VALPASELRNSGGEIIAPEDISVLLEEKEDAEKKRAAVVKKWETLIDAMGQSWVDQQQFEFGQVEEVYDKDKVGSYTLAWQTQYYTPSMSYFDGQQRVYPAAELDA
jgi:hypothetical protein